jgi:hypothetical protein
MDRRLSLLLAPFCMLSMIGAASAEGLRVRAAGSLREVMAEIAGRIDIIIGYCTGAKLRLSQMSELHVTEVPPEIGLRRRLRRWATSISSTSE